METPVTLEGNKEVVRSYVAATCRRDMAGMSRLMADDAYIWIAGRSPLAGVRTKKEFLGAAAHLFEIVEGPAQIDVVTLTAEDDRVSVTLQGRMMLKDGRQYHNQYHILVTIRDDQIIRWEEFYDTELVDYLRSASADE